MTILSIVLLGCGEKNTITYDFATNKATLSENFDKKKPHKEYEPINMFVAISTYCNIDNDDLFKIRERFKEGKDYVSPVCNNGITYKFINTDKAPQEY